MGRAVHTGGRGGQSAETSAVQTSSSFLRTWGREGFQAWRPTSSGWFACSGWGVGASIQGLSLQTLEMLPRRQGEVVPASSRERGEACGGPRGHTTPPLPPTPGGAVLAGSQDSVEGCMRESVLPRTRGRIRLWDREESGCWCPNAPSFPGGLAEPTPPSARKGENRWASPPQRRGAWAGGWSLGHAAWRPPSPGAQEERGCLGRTTGFGCKQCQQHSSSDGCKSF